MLLLVSALTTSISYLVSLFANNLVDSESFYADKWLALQAQQLDGETLCEDLDIAVCKSRLQTDTQLQLLAVAVAAGCSEGFLVRVSDTMPDILDDCDGQGQIDG